MICTLKNTAMFIEEIKFNVPFFSSVVQGECVFINLTSQPFAELRSERDGYRGEREIFGFLQLRRECHHTHTQSLLSYTHACPRFAPVQCWIGRNDTHNENVCLCFGVHTHTGTCIIGEHKTAFHCKSWHHRDDVLPLAFGLFWILVFLFALVCSVLIFCFLCLSTYTYLKSPDWVGRFMIQQHVSSTIVFPCRSNNFICTAYYFTMGDTKEGPVLSLCYIMYFMSYQKINWRVQFLDQRII